MYYNYRYLFSAVYTLIALFAEASDEDCNSKLSMLKQMDPYSLSVIHELKEETRFFHNDTKGFNFVSRVVAFDLSLPIIKSFMRNHGEKDVWFVKVAVALLVPAVFLKETDDTAIKDFDDRSQALQYLLSYPF